eukprot:Amastigsp_a177865_5.p1 type:complete len:106 gc:universal Amastigsp_a177865_5:364-47(-)
MATPMPREPPRRRSAPTSRSGLRPASAGRRRCRSFRRRRTRSAEAEPRHQRACGRALGCRDSMWSSAKTTCLQTADFVMASTHWQRTATPHVLSCGRPSCMAPQT